MPGNPALLFENVKGFSQPVLVNVFGHVDRIKLALEGARSPVATRPDMYREWGALMAKTIEPTTVPIGPVKDVIQTGVRRRPDEAPDTQVLRAGRRQVHHERPRRRA